MDKRGELDGREIRGEMPTTRGFEMTIGKKLVFNGKLLKVFAGRKKIPNGRKAYLEEVLHPGAVLVIPMVGEKVAFIKQYRPVISRYIWELPAGILEKGETPRACAGRELLEETGYRVKRLVKIGRIFTSPGFTDEIIYLFKAECHADDKPEAKRELDEIMTVRLLGKKEIKRLINRGKIVDSKTLAAITLSGIL